MRIGELSRRTGVSVRMLRYYEEEQLLRPARAESGYRHYSDEHADLVTRIKALNEAGLTLATVRIVLPCTDDDGQRFKPCAQVKPALEREMQRIADKIGALEDSRQILARYLQGTH